MAKRDLPSSPVLPGVVLQKASRVPIQKQFRIHGLLRLGTTGLDPPNLQCVKHLNFSEGIYVTICHICGSIGLLLLLTTSLIPPMGPGPSISIHFSQVFFCPASENLSPVSYVRKPPGSNSHQYGGTGTRHLHESPFHIAPVHYLWWPHPAVQDVFLLWSRPVLRRWVLRYLLCVFLRGSCSHVRYFAK